MPTDTPVADLAKALARPSRLRSVRLLQAKPGCMVGVVVGAVGLAQSIESEHLRIPKTAGAITREVDRPRVCYALNRPALAPLGKRISYLMPVSRARCIPAKKETA